MAARVVRQNDTQLVIVSHYLTVAAAATLTLAFLASEIRWCGGVRVTITLDRLRSLVIPI